MKPEERWYALNEKMEEFLYGKNGILTVAYADEDLKTYLMDTNKVIEILKELKELEKIGLTDDQLKKLSILKNSFLEIENSRNNIKKMYQEIRRIYENIDEY